MAEVFITRRGGGSSGGGVTPPDLDIGEFTMVDDPQQMEDVLIQNGEGAYTQYTGTTTGFYIEDAFYTIDNEERPICIYSNEFGSVFCEFNFDGYLTMSGLHEPVNVDNWKTFLPINETISFDTGCIYAGTWIYNFFDGEVTLAKGEINSSSPFELNQFNQDFGYCRHMVFTDHGNEINIYDNGSQIASMGNTMETETETDTKE